MQLFHITSSNTFINLDCISAIMQSFENSGDYFLQMVNAPTQVITSDELDSILGHITIISTVVKPAQSPQFKVGDKVRFQFSDYSSYSDEIATITDWNDTIQVATFVYADGTEFVKFASDKLTGGTHVTPALKFAVGDKVLIKSRYDHIADGLTGRVIAIRVNGNVTVQYSLGRLQDDEFAADELEHAD